MKAVLITIIFFVYLLAHPANSQSTRIASLNLPSPFGKIPSIGDSIFFNGHDSMFWKKNKYFDLTTIKTKDTSFIFGRMYRGDCTAYFRLTITDSSKIIFLYTYEPGIHPDPAPIDSMYVAYRINTGCMIRTCSFYLNRSWGGMGILTTCADGTKGCTPMLFSSPVNFILTAGRFSFQI